MSGGWNTSIVKNCFLPHEVEVILSISISQSLPDDALVWAWTKKGIFMVKSAYHVAHGWLVEGRGKGVGCEGSNLHNKKGVLEGHLGFKMPK